MNKTSLALTIVAGLWGWIAHADESAKILQLWPNCTALLNQDINWKLMDIITCPNRESLDQSIRIMPSETITYWDFTQNVSYMIAQDLPIGQEVTVSLEWLPPFTIWKSENKDGPY